MMLALTLAVSGALIIFQPYIESTLTILGDLGEIK